MPAYFSASKINELKLSTPHKAFKVRKPVSGYGSH
jgi:hypothetical protein